jgi:hypothetical protein
VSIKKEIYFLSLIWGGNFSGSNGPDWFVGKNHVAPVVDLLCKINSISALISIKQDERQSVYHKIYGYLQTILKFYAGS